MDEFVRAWFVIVIASADHQTVCAFGCNLDEIAQHIIVLDAQGIYGCFLLVFFLQVGD